MESRFFDKDEVLSREINEFAQQIVANELCARTIVSALSQDVQTLDFIQVTRGEPSVHQAEYGFLSGGIQIGYRWGHSQVLISRKFVNVELFYYHPETGSHEPSQ